MIATAIRENLIEHYEQLITEGSSMFIKELKRIKNASEEELLNMVKPQDQEYE